MIGRTVTHFEVIEKLGGGGMGIVYMARDKDLDRRVALKFLPPGLSADEEAKKRFTLEARAASALNHENICTIYEIGEITDDQEGGSRLFIAMAFYDGETLKRKVEKGPLPIDEVLTVGRQVAKGLAAAHERGIIHRDIKPANIIHT